MVTSQWCNWPLASISKCWPILDSKYLMIQSNRSSEAKHLSAFPRSFCRGPEAQKDMCLPFFLENGQFLHLVLLPRFLECFLFSKKLINPQTRGAFLVSTWPRRIKWRPMWILRETSLLYCSASISLGCLRLLGLEKSNWKKPQIPRTCQGCNRPASLSNLPNHLSPWWVAQN